MAVLLHVMLALVLTGVLVGQAAAVAAVLRSRRLLASARPPRARDLVWVAIPIAVVLALAVRSWIAALDIASPEAAAVDRLAGGIRSAPPPIR